MGTIAQEITRLQNAKVALKTALEAKGVTVASDAKLDNYPALIEGISTNSTIIAPNDVNFYDYDGTIVASYTAQAFSELEALPENPTHTGLTAQGWNWTLPDAKTYVSKYGKLEVGQMYITSDGKTRLYLTIPPSERKNIQLVWNQSATSNIDWGDTTTESVSGTGTQSKSHEYANSGDYTITIDPGEGNNISFTSYPPLNTGVSRLYLKKIFLGNVISIAGTFGSYDGLEYITIPSNVISLGSACFANCRFLKHVTIPSGIISLSGLTFQKNYSLESVSIPKSTITFNDATFNTCMNLKRLTLPEGITTFPGNFILDCTFLYSIIVPDGVTTIGSAALGRQFSLTKIILPSSTTNINSLAFTNCPLKSLIIYATTPPSLASDALPSTSDLVIYVPSESVEDYKAASVWSNYASKITAIPS